MFLVFSVLTFIAISMAPADATEYTLFVKDSTFKVRRCSVDQWCLLDSSPENPISVSVRGHALVLSDNAEASEIDVSERIVIPPEIDWHTVDVLTTAHPDGVQLVFLRTENVISVTRRRDGADTDLATISYGGPSNRDPPK